MHQNTELVHKVTSRFIMYLHSWQLMQKPSTRVDYGMGLQFRIEQLFPLMNIICISLTSDLFPYVLYYAMNQLVATKLVLICGTEDNSFWQYEMTHQNLCFTNSSERNWSERVGER